MNPTSLASAPINAPVVVLGDTSISVFLTAQLVKRGSTVVWAKGSGARLTPVMPYYTHPLALAAATNSANTTSNNVESGCFHRVFKNKAFKRVDYAKHPLASTLWEPEQLFISESEVRLLGQSPVALEEQLRAELEVHPNVTRVESVPILELEVYDVGGEVQFAGGTRFQFQKFYFCDSISELKQLPKLNSVMKHQLAPIKNQTPAAVSVLQVVFNHLEEMPYPTDTGFVIPMNRDSGETFDRDVMGYFLDSKRSVWTVLMNAEETEENHEIMKKLRKMKQSLNRAFGAEGEGTVEFTKTVEKEHVRFESSALVIHQKFNPSQSNSDYLMLSESFGLNATLEAMAKHFDIAEVSDVSDLSSDLNSALAGMDLTGPNQNTRGDDFAEVEANLS
jgi:hypothetical protein